MASNEVIQSEARECALACLAMILNHHGQFVTLQELRSRFPISLNGASLSYVLRVATTLGLSVRPLRVELEALPDLPTPCILHWDLNHFVILESFRADKAQILDPVLGRRTLSSVAIGDHFTGVVVEASPGPDFLRDGAKPASTGRSGLLKFISLVGLRKLLIQVLAVSLCLEFLLMLLPLFGQISLDQGLASGDGGLVVKLAFGFVLLVIFQSLTHLARSWMLVRLTQIVAVKWVSDLFFHLLRVHPSYFERRHSGDIQSRFGSLSEIQRTLTKSTVEALIDGLLMVASISLMFFLSPLLALICVGCSIAHMVIRWLVFERQRQLSSLSIGLKARASSYFLESIRAIVPIKLYRQERERAYVWANLAVQTQNADGKSEYLASGLQAISILLSGLQNVAVIAIGVQLVIASEAGSAAKFSVGMLFAFLAYKAIFDGRINSLANFLSDIGGIKVHFDRLADITEAEQEIIGAEDREDVETIEFRSVGFRYSDSDPWIFRGASFHVRVGESIAIVGPSGEGKSTLLRLIMGILEATEGDILINGKLMSRDNAAAWRAKFGCVLQNDTLLTGSMLDNISFFSAEADVNWIRKCADLANIRDDIEAMPMGFQSLVGDLGSALSGGQKQRVMLARALFKRPSFLLLDEATSHLDHNNERVVNDNIAELPIGKIFVAHRRETIEMAERVLVLANGSLTETKNRRPDERWPEIEQPNQESTPHAPAVASFR